MMAFLAVCVVCATVLVGGKYGLRIWLMDRREGRANDRAENMADIEARNADRELLARQVAINERQAESKPVEPLPERDEPMPSDLEDRIAMWEDAFAQEMERAGIMNLYAKHKNWDTVRLKLPALVSEPGS